MFIKEVSADTSANEVELQKVGASYGFSPKIISDTVIDSTCFISMEDLEAESIGDVYGEDPTVKSLEQRVAFLFKK